MAAERDTESKQAAGGVGLRVATRALVGFAAIPLVTLAVGALRHRPFPDFLLRPDFLAMLAAASIAAGLVLRTMRSPVALLVAPFLTALCLLVVAMIVG